MCAFRLPAYKVLWCNILVMLPTGCQVPQTEEQALVFLGQQALDDASHFGGAAP